MLEIVTGDLFDSDAQALVNAVNCAGVMGAGIAVAFRKRYPAMFEEYKEVCARGELRPGVMHVWPYDDRGRERFVINFPTLRQDYRAKTSLDDIAAGLPALCEEIRQRSIESIAVPALGCDRGGSSWDEVRPLLVDGLSSLEDVKVLVYAPAAPWVSKDERAQP